VKIVADENVDGPVVAWLRERGHDVAWMVELAAGAPDEDVLLRAADRVLLTGDRDFGRMVFLKGRPVVGVVYLRIRATSSSALLKAFVPLWPVIEEKAAGNFLVVTNDRVRVRPLGAR
jgi:predicted nuclease of predicted toxin-antitoxin system